MKIQIDLTKPRIIVHNLTLKGIEKVPGILDFDQRGILFARPHDTVATKSVPEKSFLTYLESLGWDFSQVQFVSPTISKKYTYNSIFFDSEVADCIKKYGVEYIDTYQNTIEEKKFSQRVDVPLYTNPKIGSKYGTKSGFRKLAKLLNLPMTKGYPELRSLNEVKGACFDLFKEGIETIVIKIDEGVSGAGATKLTRTLFSSWSEAEQDQHILTAISKIPQMNKESAVIVEEWRNDIVSSPSIQLEIRPDGQVLIVSIHDQLLEGDEKWYVGCSYPPATLTGSQEKQMRDGALLFADELVKKGYEGFLGLDTIITSEGDLYWVEANIRKPGTFYPRIIAEKLNGGTLDGIFYIASDFTIAALTGISFERLNKKLRDFMYPIHGNKKGIVLYNTGALRDAGRFDIVCLAHTKGEAKDIFDAVSIKIGTLRKEEYE